MTGNNAWGVDQHLAIPANQRQVVVFDNTRNPPATEPWAVRLLSWLME